MALFEVVKTKIKEIKEHSNADKLELGSIEANTYQFVVGKGEMKAGDEVIYFPIDSLLPDELSEFLNVKNFLSGKDKNRIKTVKLRGEISQGLVIPMEKIWEYINAHPKGDNNKEMICDYTEILGVVKYEPPVYLSKTGRLLPLPDLVSKYDIEGCDNFPDVLAYLMDKPVWISEKAEGTNYSITIDKDDKIFVNQRNHTIEELEGEIHSFWEASRKLGLIDAIKKIKAEKYPDKTITLRGELVGPGIQSNYYLLKDHEVKLFDLELDGSPINPEGFIMVCEQYGLGNMVVPTLSIGKTLKEVLGDVDIKEYSNGKSVINSDKIREGVVIKPLEEEKVSIGKFIGRLFIKQRSPEYLAKTDN